MTDYLEAEISAAEAIDAEICQGTAYFRGEKGDPGEKGEKGEQGEPGYTPVKGVDYFTSEDIDALEVDLKSYVNDCIGALNTTLENRLDGD